MAYFYSEELKQLNATGNSRVLPNVLSGDVRQYWFTINAGDLDGFDKDKDTVILTRIPSRARILGIALKHSAFGSDGEIDMGLQGHDGSGQYDFGVSDDPDFLVDGLNVVSAGSKELVTGTTDDAFGYETKKEVDVTLTVIDLTSNVDTIAIKGYVLVVID